MYKNLISQEKYIKYRYNIISNRINKRWTVNMIRCRKIYHIKIEHFFFLSAEKLQNLLIYKPTYIWKYDITKISISQIKMFIRK